MSLNNFNLWIPNLIYEVIINETNIWAPLETGGVLMGYAAKNGDVVVTNLIGAGPKSTRTRTSFDPDHDFQLNEIEKLYNESNGRIIYLGDWHTHPNGSPDLSYRDKKTLTNVATTPESKNNRPVMVIIGSLPRVWTMRSVQFISGNTYFRTFTWCNYEELSNIIY